MQDAEVQAAQENLEDLNGMTTAALLVSAYQD
jgi:hypothetical protein